MDEIIAIHDLVCGVPGVREPHTLDSTLARPMHTWGGVEFYPTAIQKAAALLHGLASTQAFHDGNKRTAWAACVTYLGQRRIAIADRVTQDDVYDLVMAVANHELDVDDVGLTLVEWTSD